MAETDSVASKIPPAVPNDSARPRHLGITLLLLATAALYTLTMPVHHLTGDEKVAYEASTKRIALGQPRHLLTNLLYGRTFQLTEHLGIHSRQFIPQQIMNIGFSLACAMLLYATLSLLGISRRLRLLFTALFCLANGIWEHSIVSESGIHPEFFLMLSIYLLVRHLQQTGRREWTLVAVLASFCMSVLFALPMVVLIPPLMGFLLWDWLRKRDIPFARFVTLQSLVLVVVLAIPFLIGAWAQEVRSIPGFFQYLLSHQMYNAQLSDMLGSFGFERFTRTIAGAARLFVMDHNGFTAVKLEIRHDPVLGLTWKTFAGAGLGLGILGLMSLLAVSAMWSRTHRPIKVFCLIQIAVVYLLCVYWVGSDFQFWMPALPAMLVLAAFGSIPLFQRRGLARAFYVLMGFVFVSLLVLNIPPRPVPSILCPAAGMPGPQSKALFDRLKNGDVVISPDSSWVCELWILPQVQTKNLRRIDIVYGNGAQLPEYVGNRQKFFDYIDINVKQALKDRHDIYVDGIIGPRSMEQYGNWEILHSLTGVSREEFIQHLRERYHVEEVTGLPEGTKGLGIIRGIAQP